MPSESPADRLRAALDMYEIGESMYRARLRRDHPDADDDAIEAEVVAWRQRRPGAEHGDFPGPPSSRRIA